MKKERSQQRKAGPEPGGRGEGLWLLPGQKLIVSLTLLLGPSITRSTCVIEVLTASGGNVMVNVAFQERSERQLLVVVRDDYFQSTMTIFSR